MSTATKVFSIEHKLKSLALIQKINSKLDESRFIRGQLPEEAQELEDQLQGLESRKQSIEEEINGIKEYVTDSKRLIDEAQSLIVKYEKQSRDVRNNREFVAINNEIESQQIEVKILERKIKTAGEDFDVKVASITEVNELIENKQSLLRQKKQELKKVMESTEQEEKEFNSKLEKAREKVNKRLLFTYDKIRKTYHNGLAVVPIQRDACGGCFQLIPPQKQGEISMKKKIILCENCGRMLVDVEMVDEVSIN